MFQKGVSSFTVLTLVFLQVTSAVWSGLDDLLLTGHDNGDLVQWDVKTGKKLKMSSDHGKTITDMQTSKDGSMLITSSKDCTSMLFDADNLSPMKKYVTERPVNSASLSPIFDHVVLGGGQVWTEYDHLDINVWSSGCNGGDNDKYKGWQV